MMSKAYHEYDFMKMAFPSNMKLRGFEKVEPESKDDILPGFLYRDYGFIVWEMIENYVSSVMSQVYVNDESVKNDVDLQGWADELSSNEDGRVHGFPSTITSRSQLVNILTNIIFTCSAQHAAVNNGQFDFHSFVPNRPFALRKFMPKDLSLVDEKFIVDALPNVRETCFMVSTAFVLTTPPDDYFSTNKQTSVRMALNLFGNDWVGFYNNHLSQLYQDATNAQKLMQERNKKNGYYYPYLYPFSMTLSIQV
jgi:hypothetical protein